MKPFIKSIQAVCYLIVFVALGACGKSPSIGPTEAALEPIRLTMSFRPDIQFAPMYVAVSQGFAAEEGLEIEFNHMAETEAVQLVGVNELPFAIVSGEQILLARAQGLPVVYVMAWWQDYPVAVAAPVDASITSPEDLVGRRIGIPGLFGASYIGFRALIDSAGLTEDDLTLDSIGYTQVEALSQGLDEAIVVYANNEPVQLEKLGFPVDVIRVADYVRLTSNGLITNEDVLRENPGLVRRMVRTLIHGIEATLNDPELAFEISKDYVEGLEQADREVQMQILTRSLDFWRAEQMGYSDPKAWENMQNVLLEMGLLEAPIDLSSAYSNDFLPNEDA
jgi:NitT/TauT family transport system substrate-binding protein